MTLGMISLAIGAVLLLGNLKKFNFPWGGINMIIYPAAFFFLLGIFLIFRSLKE